MGLHLVLVVYFMGPFILMLHNTSAIVFAGIDFFGVWMFLMLKRYDWLAEQMVPLGETSSVIDRIELLQTRTEWTRG